MGNKYYHWNICPRCGSSDKYVSGKCKPCWKKSRSEWHWKSRGLNLSWQDFEKQFLLQNKRCAICCKPMELHPKLKNDSPVMDHDHLTNQFRGILCNSCNRALGLFKDNIKVIENAARYLRHGVPTKQKRNKTR